MGGAVPGSVESDSGTGRDVAVGRRSAGVALTTGLFVWGLFLGYYHVKFGLDHPPAATGDEPDYDSLGWELSKGNGFQLDTGDPEFRRPYDQAGLTSPLYQLPPPRTGPITTRPPSFPIAIAGTNLLFGRQFWGVRCLNAGAMAAVVGFLVFVLFRERGPWHAAVAVFLFAAVDTRTRLYGRTILTEPLAALLVTLLCLAATRGLRRRTGLDAVGVGLLLGLLVLTRTLFMIWLPAMVLLAVAAVRRGDPLSGRKRAFQGVAALGLSAALVVIPWGIRNCLVLGRPMPLGTQGASQMSAAFGDSVWNSGGLWRNIESEGFHAGRLHVGMSTIERELATADHSRARGREWIRNNPEKAVLLFPLKIHQELRPRTWSEGMLLLLAVVGIPAAWSLPEARVGACLWVLNLCAVGVTWSVEGRFLVPLLFVQHLFAACGAMAILQGLKRRFTRSPVVRSGVVANSPHQGEQS